MNNAKKSLVPHRRFKEFQNAGAWEQRKLGEVAEKITKGTTPHDKRWFGPVNYVKTESIDSNNGNISVVANTSLEEHEGYLKRSQLEKDDVLFSIVGTLGRVGVVKKKDLPANTNQQICIIRPFKENSFFLLNALKTNRVKSFIKSDATIGAQPSLSLWQIEGLRIPFPILEEQQKIGKFFQQLDSLIALHQRKLNKLKKLKSAYLTEMFPDEGEHKPKRRFAGFTDDWEQRKLGDVVERFDNLRIPVTSSKRKRGITPYYGANGIQDYVQGYTHDGEFVLVAEDGANDLQNYPIHYVNGKVWVNNHAHVLQGKKDIADNLFLVNAIKRIKFETYLVGGSRAKLNADVMMKLPIKMPKLNEQQKLGKYFSRIDTLIALHQRKIDKLQKLKNAYLNEMFV